MPVPASSSGCGGLGLILVVIVAVVVTIFTAGALAAPAGSSLGTIFSTGAGVLSGTGTVGGIAGAAGLNAVGTAAIAAAAGSIVSRGVGIAIGVQDKFSWKQVALGGIGGGVAAGVGSVASSLGVAGSDFGPVVARAAIGNAASQGIGVVTGLQSSFDWKGVAASAVGAAAAYQVGGFLRDADVFGDLGPATGIARGTVSAFAGGLVTAAARGGRIAVERIATDAFGNALGSSLADAMQPEPVAGSGLQGQASTAATWGPQYSVDDTALPTSYTLSSGGVRLGGGGAVEAQSTPEELQASFRASEREYRSANDGSVSGAGYVPRSGDSISRIVGSSDAQAVGNFMRANSLSSDRIVAGRNYFLPEDVRAYGDSSGQGQLALNQGNERIAAANAAQLIVVDQARTGPTIERAMAMGIYSGDAATFTVPVAAGSPGAYASAYDPAVNQARQAQSQALLNFLGGQSSMALGGIAAAGVMLGTNNVIAASMTTDAVAPLDNLLAPMGGSVATRLSSGVRLGANALTAAQEAASWQGTPRFPGIDRWRDITLRQGTVIYAGEPGLSGFMTTDSAIRRSGLDAASLFDGLQVPPRNGLYRNGVTAYEVLEDLPAAMARTMANDQTGRGGLPELYLPSVNQVTRTYGPVPPVDALVNEGRIRPLVSYSLTNRAVSK